MRLSPAARVLEQLHAASWGRMADLRDSRTARYREMQLSGERGLPLNVIRCELERVGCHGPVVASVRALVEELSMRRRDALAEIEEVSR